MDIRQLHEAAIRAAIKATLTTNEATLGAVVQTGNAFDAAADAHGAVLEALQRIVSWDEAGMAMTEDHIAQATRAIAKVDALSYGEPKANRAMQLAEPIRALVARATGEQKLLEALRALRDAFLGPSVEVQADAMRNARAAIASATGEPK